MGALRPDGHRVSLLIYSLVSTHSCDIRCHTYRFIFICFTISPFTISTISYAARSPLLISSTTIPHDTPRPSCFLYFHSSCSSVYALYFTLPLMGRSTYHALVHNQTDTPVYSMQSGMTCVPRSVSAHNRVFSPQFRF